MLIALSSTCHSIETPERSQLWSSDQGSVGNAYAEQVVRRFQLSQPQNWAQSRRIVENYAATRYLRVLKVTAKYVATEVRCRSLKLN